MKLVTFDHGGAPAPGVVSGDRIVPLTAPGLPRDMTALIAGWESFRAPVEAAARAGGGVSLEGARLRQPILRPGKILALGKNYAEHAREMGGPPPDNQIWFCKHATAANGPFDPVDLPRVSEQLDYEAELVVVIGRGGRHIPAARALEHVFGYCCGDDFSVRDWQKMTPQWMIGKSFDTHAPFGPWIVTADEIADPQALRIRCLVNGETRQSSTTANMTFPVAEQIALLSQAMTLEPGDLIFTGTPEGVAMGMTPPRWLKAGDVVRVEIDGIGAISNTIRPEP